MGSEKKGYRHPCKRVISIVARLIALLRTADEPPSRASSRALRAVSALKGIISGSRALGL